MPLNRLVSSFLKEYWRGRPLLLALSGGPDSRALFEVFLELEVPFHVAHVDHGWREESGREAEELRRLCGRIPFHQCKLSPGPHANLEERGRKARLAFFAQIVRNQELESVVLGHHADDQAETVLKRLFEGATLPRLRGLRPVAEFEGLRLLRPLLSISKEQILAYLASKKITPFRDPSNDDSRFLRARMRKELLPHLSLLFGKGVRPSLCRIGEAAAELSDFVDEMLAPYRQRVEETREVVSLDLSNRGPATPFEWKMVVRDFFERQKMSVPSSVCAVITSHLQKRNAHKTIIVGKSKVEMHRGVLALWKSSVDRETTNAL